MSSVSNSPVAANVDGVVYPFVLHISLDLFHQLGGDIWEGPPDVISWRVWQHVLHHEASHCEGCIL